MNSLKHQSALGSLLVTLTALFHAAGLVMLILLLRSWAPEPLATLPGWAQPPIAFTAAVIGILLLHGIEAWLWAFLYVRLGEFEHIEQALYFSVVTTTTLGYGDFTLSERWRLLASFQAMGGLILFAASTAVLFEVFSRLIVSIT